MSARLILGGVLFYLLACGLAGYLFDGVSHYWRYGIEGAAFGVFSGWLAFFSSRKLHVEILVWLGLLGFFAVAYRLLLLAMYP